jgi:heme exporter protein D
MQRDEVVERSWRVLGELKGFADFVLIGGWAVYLWTRKLKSRDIDVYIDQENFYKLQSDLTLRGYSLKRNVRLMKFEALISDVEVDIYTPFMSKLVIPCSDVFDRKLYSMIEGFKVAVPEVLLLLKAQAAKDRWHAEKGLKDRVDIISLLKFADVKRDVLDQVLREYDTQHKLRDAVMRAISESRIEYRFLGLAYEKDGVQLKKYYENL